ncbi:hypothetical protein BH09BAC5_BH09BAC5_04160 [soil metagenome]
MKILFSITLALFLLFTSCKKDVQFLSKHTVTWDIQSMQIDFINTAGNTDSTRSSGISGFFIFYNTPTTGADPFYLNTHAITVNGMEIHAAAFYKTDGKTLTLETSIGSTPVREYSISGAKKDEMTLDYSGPLNFFYAGPTSWTVKEHIVLKRIKY